MIINLVLNHWHVILVAIFQIGIAAWIEVINAFTDRLLFLLESGHWFRIICIILSVVEDKPGRCFLWKSRGCVGWRVHGNWHMIVWHRWRFFYLWLGLTTHFSDRIGCNFFWKRVEIVVFFILKHSNRFWTFIISWFSWIIVLRLGFCAYWTQIPFHCLQVLN